MVLGWGFRCFSDLEGNSTNKCIYASSFLIAKHREPQSINAKLFLPIIPIGIVAYAFTLLWDNLCRNSCNAGKYCHITPLLFILHWLPIRERILFKILLITYKAVHGHAPNNIKELIKFKKSGKYNLRSNSDNLLLEIESEYIYHAWRPRISSRRSKTME